MQRILFPHSIKAGPSTNEICTQKPCLMGKPIIFSATGPESKDSSHELSDGRSKRLEMCFGNPSQKTISRVFMDKQPPRALRILTTRVKSSNGCWKNRTTTK